MTRVLTILLAVVGSLILAEPASADCSIQYVPSYVDGALVLQATQVCSPTITPAGDEEVDPPRDSELDAICVQTAISTGQDPFEFCDIPPEDAGAFVTPGLVATAFQQIPLPASELKVQPANGRTLVNFETNFFTEAAPFDRTVTLLGQRVELHIVPSRFGWRFGDGRTVASTDAGAPYPDLRITHDYQRKGRVQPAVDTTYTATYRVNGGAWAAVPGSVTVAGDPVDLEVLTATPVLVGS
jgi:hypothetical protein